MLDFQTLAFFFFLFAPRLHHRIESFKPKFRHFLHLIHKNSPFRGQQLNFANSVHKNGHFYGQQTSLQRVAGDLVRGTNCTRHGIMRKSPPGNHSRHTNFPEDKVLSPHHEIYDRSRSYRTYQEPPSELPRVSECKTS